MFYDIFGLWTNRLQMQNIFIETDRKTSYRCKSTLNLVEIFFLPLIFQSGTYVDLSSEYLLKFQIIHHHLIFECSMFNVQGTCFRSNYLHNNFWPGLTATLRYQRKMNNWVLIVFDVWNILLLCISIVAAINR